MNCALSALVILSSCVFRVVASADDVCEDMPPAHSGCGRLIQDNLKNISISTVTSGPYTFDKCLGGGGKHETWLVHSEGGLQFAMKLRKQPSAQSENLTAEERTLLELPADILHAYTEVLCGKAQALKYHYPSAFVDCVASGVTDLPQGRFAWAALELAPGRTLRSLLVESPEEPPPQLGTLLSVFNMSLRIFGVMDQGIRPVDQRSFRYVFSDVQWGNVMVDNDGGITLVDYDDEEVVACYSGDRAQGHASAREFALPACTVITEEALCYRHTEMIRDLFINTLLMLLRITDRSEWAEWSFDRSVDPGNGIPFVPKEALGYFYNLKVMMTRCWTGNSSAVDLQIVDDAAALESIVARMRSAYASDWSHVSSIGPKLLASISEAAKESKWPPTFIDHLREARDLLQTIRPYRD